MGESLPLQGRASPLWGLRPRVSLLRMILKDGPASSSAPVPGS